MSPGWAVQGCPCSLPCLGTRSRGFAFPGMPALSVGETQRLEERKGSARLLHRAEQGCKLIKGLGLCLPKEGHLSRGCLEVPACCSQS